MLRIVVRYHGLNKKHYFKLKIERNELEVWSSTSLDFINSWCLCISMWLKVIMIVPDRFRGWHGGGASGLPVAWNQRAHLQDRGEAQAHRSVRSCFDILDKKKKIPSRCTFGTWKTSNNYRGNKSNLNLMLWVCCRMEKCSHRRVSCLIPLFFFMVVREAYWWRVRSVQTQKDNYIPNSHVAKVYHG